MNIDMRDPENKTENRVVDILVYIIVMVTALMVAPLIYELAQNYPRDKISAAGEKADPGERNAKNKNYAVIENNIDISGLRNTEFGALTLICAKVANSGELILFCSYRAEISSGQPENPESAPREQETRLQIAAIKNLEEIAGGDDNPCNARGEIQVYGRALYSRYNLLESVQGGDYTFKDFGDGTFFMSNDKTAFLFDFENMKIAAAYTYPPNYHVYHSALSPNKEMLALATEEGFFIGNLASANAAATNSFDMKELISATVNQSGVKMTARHPFWSSDGERIFYKLYADEDVRNAGATTTSPGGNEQLTALECTDFLFMDDDFIFYYFSSAAGSDSGILFRCGYFNANERKMTDVMKSQVYYFDVDISPGGTFLAALSQNGNLTKISIIDIRTKKLIYSCLYSEIYDFSFSPDEKNMVIHGRENGRRTLKTVNIDWTED